MEAKGIELIGPVIGIGGGILLLISGIASLSPLTVYLINFGLGLLGLIGAIYGLTRNRTLGALIMLISGLLAILAIFSGSMGTFFFIGPILLLIGGILGYILKN
jgi:hypothetical protein